MVLMPSLGSLQQQPTQGGHAQVSRTWENEMRTGSGLQEMLSFFHTCPVDWISFLKTGESTTDAEIPTRRARAWLTWVTIWRSRKTRTSFITNEGFDAVALRIRNRIHALLVTKCEGKKSFLFVDGLLKDEYNDKSCNRQAALSRCIPNPRARCQIMKSEEKDLSDMLTS